MANAAKTNPKAPTPFITRSSRETLGWSTALFLLFGWLFFLGVLVGRGSIEVNLIPTDVQRELAVMPDKQTVPGLDKKSPDSKTPPPSVELSFYKEVKQSEEAITKSSRMTKTQKPVIPPGQAAQPEATSASPSPAPVVARTERPAPVSPPITPPSEGFTIQVAAHIQEESADAEAKALRNQGFPAYFMAATNSKGQTWYRVRVGHFAKHADAAKALSRLARLKSKAYVVKL
ncbi:SPOR domain-containing protein [Desulfoluna sp.]|uniref:SPOR domain-containing protein n=1 Tax=Desulfoluna sp. TaxID=2045199 RepID=UPI0026179BB7|nr:SPOR domain-containing protein [Desulfoluna sp.]